MFALCLFMNKYALKVYSREGFSRHVNTLFTDYRIPNQIWKWLINQVIQKRLVRLLPE